MSVTSFWDGRWDSSSLLLLLLRLGLRAGMGGKVDVEGVSGWKVQDKGVSGGKVEDRGVSGVRRVGEGVGSDIARLVKGGGVS